MQKEERYQFIRNHYNLGINLNGHVMEVETVSKCKKLCSCRDPGGHGCDDQWITYHLTTGFNMVIKYDECVRELVDSTRPVLLKPDILFEVL